MGVIRLTNIRTYSYHGCLKEEAKIGSHYRVDLEIETDLNQPASTDNLNDTIDYVQLNKIVTKEMGIRSKLLEHVAKRTMSKIFAHNESIYRVRLSVAKLNPPIGGDVESVTVEIEERRH